MIMVLAYLILMDTTGATTLALEHNGFWSAAIINLRLIVGKHARDVWQAIFC